MIHTPTGTFPQPGPRYLAATRFFDINDVALRTAVTAVCAGALDDTERAVRLFYWVRDGWRYDPFAVTMSADAHVASHVLAADRGYCVSKALLLCAAARAAGIPSAIGLADVTNHLTSEKLKQWMGGSTLFINHGYALLHIAGKWRKAAPAFNIQLCQRFGVIPTEFDGRADAILQEFDQHHRQHMSYVADHGVWSDLPYEKFSAEMLAAYPNLAAASGDAAHDFVP